jgi:hypothetical protein
MLLSESVHGDLGRFTRELSREFIRGLSKGRPPETLVLPVPVSHKSRKRKDYRHVKVYVELIKSVTHDKIAATGNFVMPRKIDPHIRIKLYFPMDYEVDPKTYSEIYKQFSTVMRHEGEHAYQWYANQDFELKGRQDNEFERVREYFLSPQEIGAYVAQMKFQATRKKEPFEERLMKVRNAIQKHMMDDFPEIDNEKIIDLMEEIELEWRKYARRRFGI